MAKPTAKSNWGVSNPDFANRVVEPSAAKKIAAWLDDERPPAPIMNWLFWIHGQWIDYFEGVTDAFAGKYPVVVGTGADATHATLQDANNDGALGTDLWVLVKEDESLNSAVSLTKARWRVDFAPGVVFSKGGGAPTSAISVEAEGIELNYGRFTGWTSGGDSAIKQLAAAEYAKVFASRFGPGTTTEVDQSAVPAGKQGPVSDTITEV
jgi:hypothetical protein